jgi:hypothetical protein
MTKCLISLLAAGLFFGCTIDATGPSDSADAAFRNATSFCNQWAKAACNSKVVMRCNQPSANDCIENQSAFCETLVPAGYSSKNAQECIDAVKKAYADAELIGDELTLVLRLGGACSHLIAGPGKAGDACSVRTDCDTVHNYDCVIKSGDTMGSCEIPVLKSAGDACDDAQAVCEQGSYCAALADGSGSVCAASKAEGKTCHANAECDPSTLCSIADGDTSGTCKPKLDLGADCTADTDCASGFCYTTADSSICANDLVVATGTPLCDDL